MSAILDNIDQMRTANPLQEVSALELDERKFKSLVSRQQPCIIRGAVAHWQILEKWRNKDYLVRRCGHRYVDLVSGNNRRMLVQPNRTPNILFSEALRILHSEQTEIGSVIDTSGFRPGGYSELLHGDLEEFSFFRKMPRPIYYPRARYFVYRNAGTSWHCHFTDETLMCQIIGSKKVGLLERSATDPGIIEKSFAEELYYKEPLSFDTDECKSLKWHYACVNEGDALYIPPSWWHGVETISEGFGITAAICWRCPLPEIANISRPTTKDLWKFMLFRLRRKRIIFHDCTVVFFLLVSAAAQLVRGLTRLNNRRTKP